MYYDRLCPMTDALLSSINGEAVTLRGKRRQCEDGGNDCSVVSISQGLPWLASIILRWKNQAGSHPWACSAWNKALVTPWFWTCSQQNGQRMNSCCFKPPNLRVCNESMRGLLNSSLFIFNRPSDYSGMRDQVSCLRGIHLFSKNMYPDDAFSDSEPNITVSHLSDISFDPLTHSSLLWLGCFISLCRAQTLSVVPCGQRPMQWLSFLTNLCRNLIFLRLPDHPNQIVNSSLPWPHS